MNSTFNLITGRQQQPQTAQQSNMWEQAAQQQLQPQQPQQPVQNNTPLNAPMVYRPLGEQSQPPQPQQQPQQQAQPQQQPQQKVSVTYMQRTHNAQQGGANTPTTGASEQEQPQFTPYVSPTAGMNYREKVKFFTGEDLDAQGEDSNPYRRDQIKTYEDMTSALEAEKQRLKPETEEQKAKREKKEKREKLFAAITDGLSALSNVYFTTQYAPNMASNKTLTGAVSEKYERMKAEREADRDKYLNMLKMKADNLGRLGDMDDAKKARRAALIKSAYDLELKQDENARKNRESDNKIYKGIADANKANAETDLIKVRTVELPKTEQSKRDLNAANVKKANADASRSYAQAAKARVETAAARKKAEREAGKYTLNLGKKGVLTFKNEKEYYKNAVKYAEKLGVPIANIEGEIRDRKGKVTKKGTVRYKPMDVVAGYVESVAENFDWDDTAPQQAAPQQKPAAPKPQPKPAPQQQKKYGGVKI